MAGISSLDPLATAGADQLTVRRTNLGLVLRRLRDHGPRSRAGLAGELGMTRSAVSALVADLAERGLVRTGQVERGGVGRPGTSVALDGRAVGGLGAEINVNHVSALALDLRGQVVSEHKIALDTRAVPVEEVLDRLAELVRATLTDLEGRDMEAVGLTVGVAGLVDRTRAVLTHGPNLGWHDVPVGELLRSRLGARLPITVDNEGNLAAIAEATPGDPDRQDVLVIFGEVGVGGGIVAGGRLLRGRQGYAGEFGHMIVEPQGRRCGCGRVGCWETVTGLRALLDLAADPDDPVRDPALAIDDRLAELNRRASLGDARTLAALERVGGWVGVGAALLTNVLNPASIVLSGYFAAVGHHMRVAIEAQLLAGVLAPDAGGTRVELSTLGFTAAVRGGAALALETVFADPTCIEPRALAEGAAR
ncbi:MAG TPA: ROK family transcriptional regulator [Nocardioides sp.]|uniref:ROK family transcriptional regulator n=1 Tax=Nocardioides sp. TaxID=35761 RepID=UPI002E340298|nr:ROK family transcriptional regulator [Nocardioides sp.]HEX5089096.1 ROK family transcriptional regulator [Nocardioides sp.]